MHTTEQSQVLVHVQQPWWHQQQLAQQPAQQPVQRVLQTRDRPFWL
jgi:hypothetical protein